MFKAVLKQTPRILYSIAVVAVAAVFFLFLSDYLLLAAEAFWVGGMAVAYWYFDWDDAAWLALTEVGKYRWIESGQPVVMDEEAVEAFRENVGKEALDRLGNMEGEIDELVQRVKELEASDQTKLDANIHEVLKQTKEVMEKNFIKNATAFYKYEPGMQKIKVISAVDHSVLSNHLIEVLMDDQKVAARFVGEDGGVVLTEPVSIHEFGQNWMESLRDELGVIHIQFDSNQRHHPTSFIEV